MDPIGGHRDWIGSSTAGGEKAMIRRWLRRHPAGAGAPEAEHGSVPPREG